MALTTTFTTNPVKTIIVRETASTNTANNNITGGPAYIHTVEIDNASFGTDVYVKLYYAASATVGTTEAELVLFVKANAKRSFQFFPGLQFATGVTMATTTTAGQAGTTAPGDPPEVWLVLSETAS